MKFLSLFLLFFGNWMIFLEKKTENASISKFHDFHTSIAEVSFNEKSKSFEVILQVFTDDFELALVKSSGIKDLIVDKSKKYHPQMIQYLEKNFYLLNPKKQKILLSFVGKEIEADVTRLYFEISAKSVKGISLVNSCFTEIFDDQVNMVNVFYKSSKQTFIFKRGSNAQALNL